MGNSQRKQSRRLSEDPEDVLDLVHDAVIVRELGTRRITYWNSGAQALYGFHRNEAIGASCLDLLKPKLPTPIDAIEDEVRRHGRWEGEVTQTRRDGSCLVASVRMVLRRDALGRPSSVFEIAHDVTERKAAVKAQHESERRFRAFLDNTPVVTFLKDEDGRYVYVNPAHARVLGRSRGEVLGKTAYDFQPEPIAKTVEAHDREVLATGRPVETIDAFWMPDGTLREWLSYKFPIEDGDRRLIGGLSLDVTEHRGESRRQALLAAFVNSSLDAIITVDSRGTVISWNSAAERLLGYAAEEIVGKPFTLVLPPDHEPASQFFERLRDVDTVPPFEAERLHKDGRRVPVLISAAQVKDAEGRLVAYSAVLRDLTEARRVEAARREIEERMRTVVAALHEGVAYITADRKTVVMNPAAERILGITAEQITRGENVGKGYQLLREDGSPLPDDERPANIAYATGKPVDGMVVGVKRPDGAQMWVSANVEPVFRPGEPSPHALVISFEDITRRKQLDEELARRAVESERQRAFTHKLIEAVPAAIAFWDRDLVIRWANPAYCRLVGFSAEQLLGRTMSDVFGPEFDEKLLPITRRILETGEPYHETGFAIAYEVEGERRQTYWDFTHAPILGPDGRPEGVMNLSIEVSDRIKVELAQREKIAALEHMDRVKDEFLGVLSHELRTPINAIMGFASILDDGLAGDLAPDQRKHVERILGGSDVLLALVDDILDMSRLKAGSFTLEPAPMNLKEAVAQVVEHLGGVYAGCECGVVNEVPADFPTVVADVHRVRQVLTNLISNAVKFSDPDRCDVRVRARVDGDSWRCEVEDRGIGIAPEDVPKVFIPFTQLDMSKTRRHGGVGLGLSLCKAIVEAQGGEIGVESRPGVGSVFWFTLPVRPLPLVPTS